MFGVNSTYGLAEPPLMNGMTIRVEHITNSTYPPPPRLSLLSCAGRWLNQVRRQLRASRRDGPASDDAELQHLRLMQQPPVGAGQVCRCRPRMDGMLCASHLFAPLASSLRLRSKFRRHLAIRPLAPPVAGPPADSSQSRRRARRRQERMPAPNRTLVSARALAMVLVAMRRSQSPKWLSPSEPGAKTAVRVS